MHSGLPNYITQTQDSVEQVAPPQPSTPEAKRNEAPDLTTSSCDKCKGGGA